jgi:cyd operon protein YbgT
MWYFSWILGLGLALTFGVLNAIWYEILETQREQQKEREHASGAGRGAQ